MGLWSRLAFSFLGASLLSSHSAVPKVVTLNADQLKDFSQSQSLPFLVVRYRKEDLEEKRRVARLLKQLKKMQTVRQRLNHILVVLDPSAEDITLNLKIPQLQEEMPLPDYLRQKLMDRFTSLVLSVTQQQLRLKIAQTLNSREKRLVVTVGEEEGASERAASLYARGVAAWRDEFVRVRGESVLSSGVFMVRQDLMERVRKQDYKIYRAKDIDIRKYLKEVQPHSLEAGFCPEVNFLSQAAEAPFVLHRMNICMRKKNKTSVVSVKGQFNKQFFLDLQNVIKKRPQVQVLAVQENVTTTLLPHLNKGMAKVIEFPFPFQFRESVPLVDGPSLKHYQKFQLSPDLKNRKPVVNRFHQGFQRFTNFDQLQEKRAEGRRFIVKGKGEGVRAWQEQVLVLERSQGLDQGTYLFEPSKGFTQI